MEVFLNLLECKDIGILTILLRLLLSFIAGCVLGLERKFRTQFFGMRTLILISVSSTLLMLLSIYMGQFYQNGNNDPARIAAQVVSGIGFLGGGAILRHGFNVKGLTSAAIIWAAAALGLAIGAGFVIAAGIALVICLVSLIFIERLEEQIFPAEQLKTLRIEFISKVPEYLALEKITKKYGIVVTGIQSAISEGIKTTIKYDIRIPKYIDFSLVVSHLRKEFEIDIIALED